MCSRQLACINLICQDLWSQVQLCFARIKWSWQIRLIQGRKSGARPDQNYCRPNKELLIFLFKLLPFPFLFMSKKKVMAWFFYALFGLDMQIAFNPSYVFTEITNVLEQRNVRKKSIDLNREPFCFFYKTVMIWELAWKCNFESTFLPTGAKKIKAMNSFIFLRLNFLQSLILEYQG